MSITVILIIITVATSFLAWNKPEYMYKWIMNPYQIWHRNQWHRMLTSGFIHGDQMHLLFNMFTFYFFGRFAENILQHTYGSSTGTILFLCLYLGGIIFADIPTLYKHKDNARYNALGASGGVSSVLFTFVLVQPFGEICLYGFLCLPAVAWGAVYLAYTYYAGKRNADNVNHDAHLWGAVFGILFTIFVIPGSLERFFSQLLSIF
ncbi:rhomboid family intramembrane serine protease [Fulvitalea axinellae]|uniref:Rhomboid family intramembrane serine protease n=1 Tax=Fulvitalea axinellae TaxID=1182444 RepID=A0AAU9C8M5_9BACT|nr:rhomboid family intramembrane serine protease [Fulvitalea axinellae]